MSFGRWVVDNATRAVQVSDGVIFARSAGERAVGGARDLARGARGLHRAGMRSRRRLTHPDDPTYASGELSEIFHSDGDRAGAIAALDLAFARFRADVEPTATAIAASPARAQWWEVDVLPVLSDWSVFREHESSWPLRIATDWSTYQAWLTVLRGLRSGARAQGIALASPEPDRLPETIFERAGAGRGTKIEAAWTIGRTLLYTVVGLAGVAGMYSVWRDLRARKEQGTP